MKYIKAIVVVFMIFLGGVFFGTKYLAEKDNNSQTLSRVPKVNITANTSIQELMDHLNIYRIDEHWPAPDFSLPTLTGDTTGPYNYRGKYLLLAFWTTW